VLVTGGGTGAEAVVITLPDGTGMSMEVSMGCGSANVTVVDSNFAPVVQFTDVAVIGDAGFCDIGNYGGFSANFGGARGSATLSE
jgi:hypothetical protein